MDGYPAVINARTDFSCSSLLSWIHSRRSFKEAKMRGLHSGCQRTKQRGAVAERLEARRLLANELLTWGAGLIVGDFGGSRGGIFISRPDGSEMRQITTSQTNNYEFSGDGINLPDDHPSFSPDGKQIVFTTS